MLQIPSVHSAVSSSGGRQTAASVGRRGWEGHRRDWCSLCQPLYHMGPLLTSVVGIPQYEGNGRDASGLESRSAIVETTLTSSPCRRASLTGGRDGPYLLFLWRRDDVLGAGC
jgi:hypothetical protein